MQVKEIICKYTKYIYRMLPLKRKIGPRRYIDPRLGVEGFFKRLKEVKVEYVVLRWHKGLPSVDIGEDIDMLVSDSSLEKILMLLNGKYKDGIPCDIYTTSGLEGSDFIGMSYYPPRVSEMILKESILYKDYIKIPSIEHQFLSLAYHCVYHKGLKSGIPRSLGSIIENKNPEHDYLKILSFLSARANFDVSSINMDSLHEVLENNQWNPSNDTMERIALVQKNSWMFDKHLEKKVHVDGDLEGLVIFIVRKKGFPFITDMVELISQAGFYVLLNDNISSENLNNSIDNIRGGNWKKGIFDESGGDPYGYILAYDPMPTIPDSSTLRAHPSLSNSKILMVKIEIRKKINLLLDGNITFNSVHSSDNASQAIEYYKIVSGLGAPPSNVLLKIQEINISLITPYPILKDLSNNKRRAKVELIELNGTKAICKTFKPYMKSFFDSELTIRSENIDFDQLSTVIRSENNRLILEYYEDYSFDHTFFYGFYKRPNFLKPYIIKKIIKSVNELSRRGYHLVDLNRGNVLITKGGGVKFIDLEIYHSEITKDGTNFAFSKLPLDKQSGNMPYGYNLLRRSNYYRSMFFSFGIPEFLLKESVPSFVIVFFQVVMLLPISIILLAHNKYSYISLSKLKSYAKEVCNN